VSPPELLVLTGLHVAGVEAAITRIRALDPDVAVLHHDLRGIPADQHHGPSSRRPTGQDELGIGASTIRRRLRRGSDDVTTTIGLVHGCLSCTLREDLLSALITLTEPGGPRRIVLHLDPALEPEQICWALLHVLVDDRPVTTSSICAASSRAWIRAPGSTTPPGTTCCRTGGWPNGVGGPVTPTRGRSSRWPSGRSGSPTW